MTKFNFSQAKKKAEEAGLLGGTTAWKPKEGDNRIRLVSECLEHPGSYNGKPTFKWLCFILDRADGEVKPYYMPNNVYEQIEAYQGNPDYAFDEVPMPYDITLNVKNAGKLEVVYTVQAARTNAPMAPEEQQKVAGAGNIRDYQAIIYEQQGSPEQPERIIHRDEVPLPPEPPTPDRYRGIPPQFRPGA